MDTDVELIRSLDTLLASPAYFGMEDNQYVNTGLGFGAVQGNNVVKLMLDAYDEISFIKQDGTLDLKTCPVRNTQSIAMLMPTMLQKDGVFRINDAVIYPKEYFCPLDANGVCLNKTDNTYSIHWFSASWLTDEEKIIHQWRIFHEKCKKMFGKKAGSYIARIVYLFLPSKRSVLKKYS